MFSRQHVLLRVGFQSAWSESSSGLQSLDSDLKALASANDLDSCAPGLGTHDLRDGAFRDSAHALFRLLDSCERLCEVFGFAICCEHFGLSREAVELDDS